MSLTPRRWQEVMAVFEAALERATGERAQFLDQACGSDAALRHEIETLLAAHAGAEGFLEPPVADAVELLEGDVQGGSAGGNRARARCSHGDWKPRSAPLTGSNASWAEAE
jgi:hypothetical protein